MCRRNFSDNKEELVNPRIAEFVREVPRAAEPVREVITSPDEETPEDHDITEVQEPPQMTFSHKRKPAWARELIQDGEKYGVPEGTTRQVKRPKPFFQLHDFECAIYLMKNLHALKRPFKRRNGQMP
jgi:hypothetical protein